MCSSPSLPASAHHTASSFAFAVKYQRPLLLLLLFRRTDADIRRAKAPSTLQHAHAASSTHTLCGHGLRSFILGLRVLFVGTPAFMARGVSPATRRIRIPTVYRDAL